MSRNSNVVGIINDHCTSNLLKILKMEVIYGVFLDILKEVILSTRLSLKECHFPTIIHPVCQQQT